MVRVRVGTGNGYFLHFFFFWSFLPLVSIESHTKGKVQDQTRIPIYMHLKINFVALVEIIQLTSFGYDLFPVKGR